MKGVLVALIAQKAEVKYDPAYIIPSQIGNRINELGFGATQIETEVVGQGTVELRVKLNSGL